MKRAMTEGRMRRLVRGIPGDHGWFRVDNADTYIALAAKLREYGVPAEVVFDVLTDAYQATADEFGY